MTSERHNGEVYDGDEITVARAEHAELDAERLSKDDEHADEWFDGYPQIVTNQESEPRYDIKKEKNVMVELSDGSELAVDVYRPDVEDESFPTVMSWGQWNKDAQETVEWMNDHPQPYLISPLWDGAIEAGDFTYFVPRGYAHVIPNPRGIGDSDGGFLTLDIKRDDIADVIDWVVDQEWSTDSVGMTGPSIYAGSQIEMAVDGHPNLDAIFPWGNPWGLGEHFHGIFDTLQHHIFMGRHGNDAGLPAPNREYQAPEPLMANLPEEERERRLEEAKSHPDIKYNSKWYSYLVNPWKWPTPYTSDVLLSHYSSPHYEGVLADALSEEDLNNIDVPIWTGAPWSERHYLWATFETWRTVGTSDDEKKLTMSPPGHAPRPFSWFHDEMVRWFDKWLKGEDTGVQEEPPVKIYSMGIDKWKFESEWPLEDTEWTKLYLQPGGGLSEDQPDSDHSAESFTQPAPYEDPTVYCLRYATDPAEEETEITGPMAFYLEASIDNDDTNWIVDVVDLGPDGERQLVSQGYLKAQCRTVDEERSEPWNVVHPVEEPEPVPENEPIQYAIDLLPTSVVLQEGHQLEVTIRNQDDLNSKDALNGKYMMPFQQEVTHDIHFGDSYLLAPKIPE